MTEFLMARSATTIPDLGYLIRKITGIGIGSASEFINELSKFINIFSTIYCICAVLVLCYFGYCAFRTILAIQGFLGDAAVGAVLGLTIAVSNRQFCSLCQLKTIAISELKPMQRTKILLSYQLLSRI